MPSYSYIRKKQKATSERNRKNGLRSGEARERRLIDGAGEMRCEGGFVSFGKIGHHCLEFYSRSDDPLHYWISVNGKIRNPRTVRGVKSVAADWFEQFATSETDKNNCDHLGFVPDWSI